MCKFLLHIRKAGVLKDGLPEKHSSWTQNASSGRRHGGGGEWGQPAGGWGMRIEDGKGKMG
jgi:hypothetical protein